MRKFYFVILGLFLLGCAKKPIKIGVALPLSGILSSYGGMCLKGIELRAKLINESGGIKGRQVELLIEDNKGVEDSAQAAIERLNKEKVIAVIGPLTTKSTVAIGEYADKINLPIITPTATGAEATKNREWVWRVSFTDPFQGKSLAKFASQQLKATSACILLNPQDPYSAGLSESFENEFKNLGGKVLYKATFNTGDIVFDAQLKEIKEYNPDCIFVPSFYQEAGLIIRRARDMEFNQPFIGGDGWDSPELHKIIGDAPGANYYSTHFFRESPEKEVQEFLLAFRTEYKTEPQTFSALGYDAMKAIQECLLLTRKFTRSEFKNSLEKLKFLGATGTIDFTQGKDPRRSLMILKFEPGKPIERVVLHLVE